MTATISNWGNSQGIRLPKNIIQAMHLMVGDKLDIKIEDHKIVLEPIKVKKTFDINELVAQMPSSYLTTEEINDSVGKEEW